MVLKMVLMVMGFFKYTESKCVTIITKMGIAQFTKKWIHCSLPTCGASRVQLREGRMVQYS